MKNPPRRKFPRWILRDYGRADKKIFAVGEKSEVNGASGHDKNDLAEVAAPFEMALGGARLGQRERPIDNDPEFLLHDEFEERIELLEALGVSVEVIRDRKPGRSEEHTSELQSRVD